MSLMPYADIEQKRAYDRAYGNARREERKTRAADWKASNPERFRLMQRRHHLMTTFGITLDEYQEMFDAQGGACAICGLPEAVADVTGKPRDNLSVDHDHSTGKVRALLCHHCNAALGHAQDDPALLSHMAAYLEATR